MSFTYKIIKHIATLSENMYESKQVNIISYNNSIPKMDIRVWKKEGMTRKGITLNEQEYSMLENCFNNGQSEICYEKLLDNITWLKKDNEQHYKIDLSQFSITVDGEAILSINKENASVTYNVLIPTYEEKSQKCIDFLNNSNMYFADRGIYANIFIQFIEKDEFITIKGRIPAKDDNPKLVLDRFCEFLSDFSDAINELGILKIKQVNFENVIVIGDNLSCVHEEHKKEELLVLVDFVKENGDILKVESKACYCEKCNLFFMRRHDYRLMKLKAGNARMLCQEIEQEKYYRNPDFSKYNLNDHSILNLYGYNVNAIENLSDEQRHEILASLVDRNILGKSRIASYLAYFIRCNEGKKKDFGCAINKWNRDRDFILDYKVESRKKVEPTKITMIKYNPIK